jgi:hypothetical protein
VKSLISLFSAIALALPCAAMAGPLVVEGQNSLRFDSYHDSLTNPLGLYSNGGSHESDTFNLNISRSLSELERIAFRLDASAWASANRAPARDAVINSAYFRWEKGDVALPFRAEAGDFYGELSPRTFQKSLKGLRLEVQPRLLEGRQKHAIEAFGGVSAASYRLVDRDPDATGAVAWLVEDRTLGSLIASYAHREKRFTHSLGPEQAEGTASVGWEKQADLGLFNAGLEGEYSRFQGDSIGSGTFERGEDEGYFAKGRLALNGIPLSVEGRWEKYGDQYTPAGAFVTSNRQTTGGSISWTSPLGPGLALRALNYRDRLESADPLDVESYGVTLAGPLVPMGSLGAAMLSSDAFSSRSLNRFSTVDALTRNWSSTLNVPVQPWLLWRLGANLSDNTDQLTSALTVQREYSTGLDIRYVGGETRASLGLGIVHRVNHRPLLETQNAPSVNLVFSQGIQSLRAGWNTVRAMGETLNQPDYASDVSNLNASYSIDTDALTVTLDGEHRKEDSSVRPKFGEAYRVGATITWKFYAQVDGQRGVSIDPDAASGSLQPGQKLADTASDLQALGLGSPSVVSGLVVYEGGLVKGLNRRQRIALVTSEDLEVTKVYQVIDIRSRGDLDDLNQVYETVKKQMLAQWGQPERVSEVGSLLGAGDLAAEILAGRVVRAIDWRVQGGWVRLGVPSRTDGQVRIEVLRAKAIPSDTRMPWGLDELN